MVVRFGCSDQSSSKDAFTVVKKACDFSSQCDYYFAIATFTVFYQVNVIKIFSEEIAV